MKGMNGQLGKEEGSTIMKNAPKSVTRLSKQIATDDDAAANGKRLRNKWRKTT